MDRAIYNQRMNQILSDMDLQGLRQLATESDVQHTTDDAALEISMHKARVERTAIDRKLRLESMEWLKSHGYNRYMGLPWPPEGQLPE